MKRLDPRVAVKIRAREAEALAAGWTFAELWEARFWPPPPARRGLAAVMRADREIGEITPEYIELYRDDPHQGRRVSWRFRKIRGDNDGPFDS